MTDKNRRISKSTALLFSILQQKHQMEIQSAVSAAREAEGIPEDEAVTLDLTSGFWVYPPKDTPSE